MGTEKQNRAYRSKLRENSRRCVVTLRSNCTAGGIIYKVGAEVSAAVIFLTLISESMNENQFLMSLYSVFFHTVTKGSQL